MLECSQLLITEWVTLDTQTGNKERFFRLQMYLLIVGVQYDMVNIRICINCSF